MEGVRATAPPPARPKRKAGLLQTRGSRERASQWWAASSSSASSTKLGLPMAERMQEVIKLSRALSILAVVKSSESIYLSIPVEHGVHVPATVLPEQSVLGPIAALVEESLSGKQPTRAQEVDDMEVVALMEASHVEVLAPEAPEGPAAPLPHPTSNAPLVCSGMLTPEQRPKSSSSSRVPLSITVEETRYIEVCFE
ncbi:hypothetical protein Nepgr_024841 [Nepenthes gracilis]|uniref:Uncharacterized protein n=1 Tax=Nepenthes gracilis TaxID=150966 RepID=A0AAD3T3L7_NEPGR|nr:hypothetical protein Nepgr_024841 [Nepenthes gracilis]